MGSRRSVRHLPSSGRSYDPAYLQVTFGFQSANIPLGLCFQSQTCRALIPAPSIRGGGSPGPFRVFPCGDMRRNEVRPDKGLRDPGPPRRLDLMEVQSRCGHLNRMGEEVDSEG